MTNQHRAHVRVCACACVLVCACVHVREYTCVHENVCVCMLCACVCTYLLAPERDEVDVGGTLVPQPISIFPPFL